MPSSEYCLMYVMQHSMLTIICYLINKLNVGYICFFQQNITIGSTICFFFELSLLFFSAVFSRKKLKNKAPYCQQSTKVNFLFNGHGVRRSVNIVAFRWPSSGAATALFKCHSEILPHTMPTPFSPDSWILKCHSPHEAINFVFVCLARS